MLFLLVILGSVPPPDTFAADAISRLLRVHGYGQPAADRALSEAAVELAARHIEAAPKDAQQAAATLRFVLAKHGVADTHVVPFTLWHRTQEELADRLPSIIARIEPRLAPTHLGTGARRVGERWLTTVLLVHRAVELNRVLPRRADPTESLVLEGPLRKGYFKPRVLVSTPDGGPVRDLDADTGERGVKATVVFDRGPGPYDVEIVADSPQGPVVLINHRIYAGVQPPGRPQPPAVAKAQGKPEHVLAQLINERRAKAGVRPLKWHPTLAQVALAHAQEMAEAKSMRHVSPEEGPLTARLKQRGLKSDAVAENLALADSPEAALAAFMDSPGHKRNLFLRPISHVGIGVVGRYYAVAMARLGP